MPKPLVAVVGATNLRSSHLAEIGHQARLRVFEDNVSSGGEVVARGEDAEVLLVNAFTPVSAPVVRELPTLQAVVSCSAGIDHVDLDACRAVGVDVRWFPGYCARTLAEKTLAYILMGLNRITAAMRNVADGGWGYLAFQGREAPTRTVAIVGLGVTGRIVRELCVAVGFRVAVVTSSTVPAERAEILRQADVVTLHAALNARTAGFLGAATLGVLKRDVVLVNTARGELVDDEALARFLIENPDAQAFLDVVSEEPPRQDHPFRRMPNVVLTPHVGWNSVEADRRLAELTHRAVLDAVAVCS